MKANGAIEIELLARVGDNEPRPIGKAVVEIPLQVVGKGGTVAVTVPKWATREALRSLLEQALQAFDEMDDDNEPPWLERDDDQ